MYLNNAEYTTTKQTILILLAVVICKSMYVPVLTGATYKAVFCQRVLYKCFHLVPRLSPEDEWSNVIKGKAATPGMRLHPC